MPSIERLLLLFELFFEVVVRLFVPGSTAAHQPTHSQAARPELELPVHRAARVATVFAAMRVQSGLALVPQKPAVPASQAEPRTRTSTRRSPSPDARGRNPRSSEMKRG